MIRALITAYDVNPYSGSESATGWNYIYEISRVHKVVAVTRKNNKENIEKYIEESKIDTSNLNFYYFDLPYWMRFWKKGPRGSMFYYYLWQIGIALAQFRHRKNYDLVHSLNFHCDWIPSFLWLLNKPFIWGPVNHNEKIPKEFLCFYGRIEIILEDVKWAIKNYFWKIDPFMIFCQKRATKILQGHSFVGERLNIPTEKLVDFSQIASGDVVLKQQKKFNPQEKFTVITVGRFISIKGMDVVIKGFGQFVSSLGNGETNVRLVILGTGKFETLLKNLVKELDLGDKVDFLGWVDKEMVNQQMEMADVFCLATHEGAGMVFAEALSYGLPVVCLDNYRSQSANNDIYAIHVDGSSYKKAVQGFANTLFDLFNDRNRMKQISQKSVSIFKEKLTWKNKGKRLADIYNEVML